MKDSQENEPIIMEPFKLEVWHEFVSCNTQLWLLAMTVSCNTQVWLLVAIKFTFCFSFVHIFNTKVQNLIEGYIENGKLVFHEIWREEESW